jgi:Peptidase family C25
VNYLGHGSEEQWSGSDIFDTTTVGSLSNGSQLPVFLTMDCLNGFFQDIYSQPLGVSLLLAPNGGAVAVLASSGLNQPSPQTELDKLVVQSALSTARPTLGESVLKAKAQITDGDVRRTFVLLGDPAMQVKQPAADPANH